jgi:hypothetical protein
MLSKGEEVELKTYWRGHLVVVVMKKLWGLFLGSLLVVIVMGEDL